MAELNKSLASDQLTKAFIIVENLVKDDQIHREDLVQAIMNQTDLKIACEILYIFSGYSDGDNGYGSWKRTMI